MEATGDEAPARTTRVLFISGFGRSGSTILGQMLGSTPGLVHVGETNFLWQQSVLENGRCGCGLRFRECPFWTDISARAFGDIDTHDVNAQIELQRSGTRTRHAFQMLMPSARRRLVQRMQPYVEEFVSLFRSVREVSGAQVIVDSSKLPTFAFLMSGSPEIDARVVHLVRDPRAAAFSWLRRPTEGHLGEGRLPRIGLAESSLSWASWNFLTDRLWSGRDDRFLKVRYEDLVAEPERVLKQILTFAGVPDAQVPFCGPHCVDLVPCHTLAGNPNRFDAGKVEIRLDDEWRSGLATRERMLVTALTFPMLRRYRYPVRMGSDSVSRSRA